MTSALTLHTTSYPSRAAQILCEATDIALSELVFSTAVRCAVSEWGVQELIEAAPHKPLDTFMREAAALRAQNGNELPTRAEVLDELLSRVGIAGGPSAFEWCATVSGLCVAIGREFLRQEILEAIQRDSLSRSAYTYESSLEDCYRDIQHFPYPLLREFGIYPRLLGVPAPDTVGDFINILVSELVS